MTCEEVLTLLDDLIDGDLDAQARADVERHLATCEACRGELQAIRDLLRRAAALPDEITPTQNLWPAVAQRIADADDRSSIPATPGWWRSAPILAAAAMLVVSLATVVLWRVGQAPPADSRSIDATGNVQEIAVRAAYRDVDDDLASVRDHLRAVLDERRDQISPATMDVVMENLAVIEASIENISRALEDSPENPELNRLLLAAYRSEVKLLQRATELPTIQRQS